MAITRDSSRKKQPKNSCFLGCFGFSGENSKEKLSSENKAGKMSKWFSWSRKKRSTTKTVPVNTTTTVVEKSAKPRRSSSKDIHMLKLSSTLQPPPVNRVEISPVAVAGDQGVQHVDETKCDDGDDAEAIVIEKSKSLETLPDRKSTTARRTVSNLEATKTPPHTANLTPPKWKKPASSGGGDSTKSNDDTAAAAANFDSLVGMSIIMITLIIMLVWGKLCAILCTSAWFYFVSRFTAKNGSNLTVKTGEKEGKFDPNSDECKKKVVLEGLLARNNHRSGGKIGPNK